MTGIYTTNCKTIRTKHSRALSFDNQISTRTTNPIGIETSLQKSGLIDHFESNLD